MNTDEFEALAGKCLMGEASADEQARLAKALAADPERKQEFAELESLGQRLQEMAPALRKFASPVPALPDHRRRELLEVVRRHVRSRPKSRWPTALAAVVVAGVFVWLNTGDRVIIRDHSGNFRLSRRGTLRPPPNLPLDREWQHHVKSALVSNTLEELPSLASALRPLRSQSALLSGSTTDSLVLLAPLNACVLPERVSFRWTAVPGAQSYLLRIQSPSGFQWQTNVVNATNLALTRAQIDLPAGQTCLWTVETRVAGREHVARARSFHVFEAATAENVRRLEAQLAGSSLALGILYAAHGMLDEAQANFEELRARNPDNSNITNWLEILARRKKGIL